VRIFGTLRQHKAAVWLLALSGALFIRASGEELKISLADGFDYPVGKPNADGYYKSRGLRLRAPKHFGEDWCGRGGSNTCYGDPMYAIADGIVTWAYNAGGSWGNVIMTRHAYRDPASGTVKYIDTLNGHLSKILVRVGQPLKRGQQIGAIGNNFGMYAAHLHFEIRSDLSIGFMRESTVPGTDHWLDPSQFIDQHRKLNHELKPVPVPTGTYQEYKGFKGL